jgi:hypothetical protein
MGIAGTPRYVDINGLVLNEAQELNFTRLKYDLIPMGFADNQVGLLAGQQ